MPLNPVQPVARYVATNPLPAPVLTPEQLVASPADKPIPLPAALPEELLAFCDASMPSPLGTLSHNNFPR